jgi:hypothetical protein
VWYIKEKDYSIYTSIEWSCRKDEQYVDGKNKVHSQWCWVREIILRRGSGYCMLPSQQITLISVTHYFGNFNDDIIDMCSGSQHDFFPEKRNFFPPLQGYFLESVRKLLILHSAEIYHFCRLLYGWSTGFP